MKRTTITLLTSLIVCFLLQPAAFSQKTDWYDTFYQYRIPVVVEAKKSGLNVVPITESAITSAVNVLEEMKFDPLWFAYNHLKVVEVDSRGNVTDPNPMAGFYLIPEGVELIDSSVIGKKEGVTINTEKGAYYLLSFLSAGGGSSPTGRYDPTWPIGHERRKNEYQVSYNPKLLPQAPTQLERLFHTDGKPMKLDIRNRWVTGLKKISLRKVQIIFVANIKTPGEKRWMIYYQPLNGHHLIVPKLRYPKMPSSIAKVISTGTARKYLGNTRYLLASNKYLTAWFAETTAKLTPGTPPPTQSSKSVKITSAKNEAQSFQIVLRPKKPFIFKNIRAGSLKSGKHIIPSSNVSFYAVDYVPISQSSDVTPAKYLGPVGDPLVAVAPTSLSQKQGNFVLWVTIKTPAGSPAGIYRGTLDIVEQKGSSLKIPVELEVYDFALPEYSPFTTSFGGSHIAQSATGKKSQVDYHHLSSREEIKKLALKYYDVMARNKLTPHSVVQYTEIGMDWSPPPQGYNVDKPGNYFKLHNWDFAELNRVLKHYIDDLKVNAFTIVHTNPSVVHRFKHLPGKYLDEPNRMPPHVSLAWQIFREATFVGINKDKYPVRNLPSGIPDDLTEITLAQYDRLLLDFYGTIAENLNKHGWLDHAYILVDETAYRGYDEFLHMIKLLKSNPLTARIKFAWTIQSTSAFNHKVNPADKNYAFNNLLDIYIPEAQENYHWWEKYFFTDYDIVPERKKLWTYVTTTARVAIDAPGINNRAFALEVFNYGGSGYLCWASFMWDSVGCETDNPWKNPWTRWGNGAMTYFYPPRKNGPAPVPDWTIVPSIRVMTYREGVDDYEYAYTLEALVKKADAKGIDASGAKKVLKDIERFFPSTVHWSQNDAWYLDLRHRIARAIVDLRKIEVE